MELILVKLSARAGLIKRPLTGPIIIITNIYFGITTGLLACGAGRH